MAQILLFFNLIVHFQYWEYMIFPVDVTDEKKNLNVEKWIDAVIPNAGRKLSISFCMAI